MLTMPSGEDTHGEQVSDGTLNRGQVSRLPVEPQAVRPTLLPYVFTADQYIFSRRAPG